jgi:hypothetical protein
MKWLQCQSHFRISDGRHVDIICARKLKLQKLCTLWASGMVHENQLNTRENVPSVTSH